MRRYTLLTKNDIIRGERYEAIVYYHAPSPNRNPMLDSVYYDEYGNWCGTPYHIAEIVDESIISVLFKHNPQRACEIVQGGYIEDDRYNKLIINCNFHIQEAYENFVEAVRGVTHETR